ncbi:hypothetical protein SAMN04487996_105102 [Dyadobacter soli]|uniref:HipA-like kinase domain-containing protein n=1 Tax=Dyadobacter soli TaxID=659014 RepID=A0A1G7D2G7_9BACT|nr:HipA family kinase [Dyadobacter soli]SDE45707.1 hypothetical protein SAMN04487996_105102 [Dyadobacter soli]
MLPVYRAIQKVASLQGGTTRPWKVIVLKDNTPTPFVVKFFNSKDIEDAQHVAREVFSNAIASDLDLSVPEPALILLDEAFIATLDVGDREFLEAKDSRVKYGSQFIEGSVQYTRGLGRHILDRYEVENIYAFDNLVHNVDRKNIKPNILLRDNSYYLIDHELTLPINLKSIQNVRAGVSFYEYRIHIFYKYLRLAKHDTKLRYFESFEDHLRYMRPVEKLSPLRDQLIDLDHPVGDFDTLIEYLNLVKQNPSIFTKILKNQVL